MTVMEWETLEDTIDTCANKLELQNRLEVFANYTMESALKAYTNNGTNYSHISGKSYPHGIGAFNQTITDLTPGTVYYYRAWVNNSLYTVNGSILKFMTLPNKPYYVISNSGSNYINLTWHKGVGAQYTVIESNTIETWNRGDGTEIYNGAGNFYNNTGLGSGTKYYYQLWSFTTAEGLSQYSSDYFGYNQSTETPAPNPLMINANFDSGRIESYTINGNIIDLTLTSETLVNTGDQYTYWTYFKALNTQNKNITFRITNADLIPFLQDTDHNPQLVYSYDGITWNRLTNHTYSAGVYTFWKNFTENEVQIATFFPFSYTAMQDYLETVNASQWAIKTTLGKSQQNRNISLLTITNPIVPNSTKKTIYIVGRQHASETASSHMLQGLINFLISDSDDAQRMRDNFLWCIVPMVNPDGVYLGNTRATSELRDPNRDWHPDNHESIEIDIVRADVIEKNNLYGIDFFVDWHNQVDEVSWYNYIYYPSGDIFYQILSDWTDFDHASSPGTSYTVTSCSARGYGMTNLHDGPTFTFEPCPHLNTWTIDSLHEQGVKTAYAIDEYFPKYTLTVSTVGNGTVVKDPDRPTYFYDDVVQLTATADAEWSFDHWSGDLSGSANPANLAITRDMTVTAQFTSTILLTDSTFDASIDSADLRTNSAGQDWYESRNDNPLLLTLDTNDIGGNTGKKGAIKNFGFSNSVYLTQEFISPQTGTFDVSFDIYIDRIEDNANYDRTGHIFIGNDWSANGIPLDTARERFVLLAFYDPTPGDSGDDLELRARTLSTTAQSWTNTGLWPTVASGLSYDTWYTIKVAVNYPAGTYDVTINGVTTTYSKMDIYDTATDPPISYISFMADSVARGDFYVDNVYSPAII
jgi:hypothetical protein